MYAWAKCSEASDMFSFGLLVYYLATGKVPFAEECNKKQNLKTLHDSKYVPAVLCNDGNPNKDMIVKVIKACWTYPASNDSKPVRPSAAAVVKFLKHQGTLDKNSPMARSEPMEE